MSFYTGGAIYEHAPLRLDQLAFLRDALMLFVCTFDAIFELAPIVWELLGHFVGPPGTLRLIAGIVLARPARRPGM
jgi:hypothetical protein